MSKQIVLMLIVGLCAVALSLHFAMESFGGIHGNCVDGQTQETSDSHEEDQFVLSELGSNNSTQQWISRPFAFKLKIVSRPLPPLLTPPKSI